MFRSSVVTVCLTVINGRKLVSPDRVVCFFIVSPTDQVSPRCLLLPFPASPSAKKKKKIYIYNNPKVNCCFRSWRSAISSEHSWLKEKHYWFFFFLFPTAAWQKFLSDYTAKTPIVSHSNMNPSDEDFWSAKVTSRYIWQTMKCVTDTSSSYCKYYLLKNQRRV